MSASNADQIAEWNGALGERWAQLQQQTEAFLAPFGEAALAAAKPVRGERVVDVGCGCGDTSIALAQVVGPAGAVVGVDVSRPMLAVARERGEALGLAQLNFVEADATDMRLPTPASLAYSRFGVMFFADPVTAFSNIRGNLVRGGRMAFICWRHPRDNPWAMTPLVAARHAIGAAPPPADLNAPGPFAFWDAARLQTILADAGFSAIGIMPFDADVFLGTDPRDAAESAARIGPLSRLVREVGAERLPEILVAVEAALRPFQSTDGSVRLKGGTWLVEARAPG
jgi:SAM-dependent methyltransferase